MECFDCFVGEPALAGKTAEYGWGGACVARDFDSGFKGFLKGFSDDTSILAGALVGGDVARNARRALDAGADVVLVSGGPDEVNRLAAECWEADVLLHPERGGEKDFMDQKNSGLDAIIARAMAGRGIMLGIVLSEILSVSGGRRVQLLGRIRQNIVLARKYGVGVVYCSGAVDEFGLRAPRDVMALLSLLGLGETADVVSKNPALLFAKARDRNNPNVLSKGLRVVSWGDSRPPEKKKKYGWL